MTIYNNSSYLEEFAGLKVKSLEPKDELESLDGIVYRLSVGYELQEEGVVFAELLQKFLNHPEINKTTALVIGCWDSIHEGGSSEQCIEQLVAASEKLSGLISLFIGDIIVEDCEVSWIEQTDVSAIFDAYPLLEEFRIRGSNGLTFGKLSHEILQKLTIESGGLNATIVKEISSAHLPQLEYLDLWLGSPAYEGDCEISDLEQILSGKPFPKLKYLGLRNCEISDDIAKALVSAPILEQLEVLDLSMGTIGDAGAISLIESGKLTHLKKLDLQHHFISDKVCEQLKSLGIEVNLENQEEPYDWGDGEERYCAVSE